MSLWHGSRVEMARTNSLVTIMLVTDFALRCYVENLGPSADSRLHVIYDCAA